MKVKTESRAEYRVAAQGDTDKTKDDAKLMPHGFMHRDLFNGEEHRVYFIDPKGKDISFDRWRFDLYYANSSAMTHFEQSQEAAAAFFEMFSPVCFANYTDFRTTFQRLNG